MPLLKPSLTIIGLQMLIPVPRYPSVFAALEYCLYRLEPSNGHPAKVVKSAIGALGPLATLQFEVLIIE